MNRRRKRLVRNVAKYTLVFTGAGMIMIPAGAQFFGFPIDSIPLGSALTGAERMIFQQGTVGAGTTIRDTLANALNKIQPPAVSQRGGVFSSAPVTGQLVSGIDTSGNVLRRALVSGDLPAMPFSSLTGIPTTLAGYGITDGLTKTLNLSDISNTAAARSNLGLAAIATSANANDLVSGTVAAARGGAGTVSGALKGDGAGNVSLAGCLSLSDNGTGLYCGAARGQLLGTNTNDDATAGNIGEANFVSLAKASGHVLGTGTPDNTITQSFGVGDWEIWGISCWTGAVATTVSSLIGSVNTVSGVVPAVPGNASASVVILGYPNSTIFNFAVDICQPVPAVRQKFNAPTSVYLVTAANFGVSGVTGYGALHYRRMR